MRFRTFRRRYGRPFRRRYRRYVRRTLGSQSRVYSFKRSVVLTPWANINDVPTQQTTTSSITNNNGVGNYQFGYFKFKLNDLPNSTDFTNLYERYKIIGVKLRFIPQKGDGAEVGTNAYMSPLAIAVNRGNISLTADDRTFANLLETQDARIYSTQKPFSVYIPYPKFYAPGDGITQAQEKSGWLQKSASAVHHFGLQYAWQFSAAAAVSSSMTVIGTYYVKAANPQ